ncbi:DUF3626 domain-containing protein [Phycicoccus sp. MAQZ13P-2]|uniref:DUF3626 domain-containing protein n=1 Tax=Phycicoccus mangrovi TaxID=2840470 RepID=UPI001C000245|nr:DUF3626 domain-containing protein [Phycicoccus mangrovi]MBT9254260.1 DUF3626 domain-containing protein [Phycicoccus mangrovi]MBT9272638.1 DUF3626 domain-containing protein [Phycicoccus mangrovi]
MTGADDRRLRALEHVRRLARGGPLDPTLRVTVNFHPDRTSGGRTVLEHLGHDRVYRSQFETGTSNGGLTAHPGGSRWRWEQRMFGGAYDDAPAAERPRYGALDHRRRGLGGAPRFGSAHLRLATSVLPRTTFCFPDSVFLPTAVGTVERCDLIGPADAFAARPLTDALEREEGGVLDDYVEAQVHGPVRIPEDVEALVLDPCFRGSEVEHHAAALGVPVEWHEGRVLEVAELERHPDYRGPQVVEVGRRVAEEGRLDAAVVGRAVETGREDPQDLKKVWHHVVRFGSPRGS